MRRYEPNPVIEMLTQKLNAHLDGMQRGERLSHEELEAIIDRARNTSDWKTVLTKARRELIRKHGITLESIHGWGYKLSTHREQLHDVSDKRQRHLIRTVRQSRCETECLQGEIVGDHDQRVLAVKLGGLQAVESSLKAQRIREWWENRKSPTISSGFRPNEGGNE